MVGPIHLRSRSRTGYWDEFSHSHLLSPVSGTLLLKAEEIACIFTQNSPLIWRVISTALIANLSLETPTQDRHWRIGRLTGLNEWCTSMRAGYGRWWFYFSTLFMTTTLPAKHPGMGITFTMEWYHDDMGEASQIQVLNPLASGALYSRWNKWDEDCPRVRQISPFQEPWASNMYTNWHKECKFIPEYYTHWAALKPN